MASHGPDEVVAIESQQSGPHGSADRRGSRLTAKQSDLTKRLALTLKLPMGAVLEYLDAASVDQVEAIADIALGDHLVARIDLELDQVVGESLQGR